MAITKIHPIKTTLKASIDYICNDKKTDGSCLISTHACAAQTADLDFKFALSKSRDSGKNLAYHLIQSFAPGEVSPDEAHEIAKELAERHLQGRYSYVIATHIDRGHVHSHIIFCAADNLSFRKYNDCKKTYSRIRRISDALCKEHNLSIIADSHNIGKSYRAWMLAMANAQVRPNTGTRTTKKLMPINDKLLVEHSSLIDTSTEKFLSSPGLRKWADKENLKRAGELYAAMQKMGFTSIAELQEFNATGALNRKLQRKEIIKIEKQMSDISEIIKYVTQYKATLSISKAYDRSRNKDKYLQEHESELLLHNAATQVLKQAGINPMSVDIRALKDRYYALKNEKYQMVMQEKQMDVNTAESVLLERELHKFLRDDMLAPASVER